MQCPNCRTMLADSLLQCANCGANLAFLVALPDGRQLGPYSLGSLQQYMSDGRIPPGASASSRGGPWTLVQQAIASAGASGTAPVPATTTAPPGAVGGTPQARYDAPAPPHASPAVSPVTPGSPPLDSVLAASRARRWRRSTLGVAGLVLVAVVLLVGVVQVFRHVRSRTAGGASGPGLEGLGAALSGGTSGRDAPGGAGWRAREYSVGNTIGPVVISDAYLARVTIEFGPDFPDISGVAEESWEVCDSEGAGRDFEVFSFVPPGDDAELGDRTGCLVISGPPSAEELSAAAFRLKGQDDWVVLTDVYREPIQHR